MQTKINYSFDLFSGNGDNRIVGANSVADLMPSMQVFNKENVKLLVKKATTIQQLVIDESKAFIDHFTASHPPCIVLKAVIQTENNFKNLNDSELPVAYIRGRIVGIAVPNTSKIGYEICEFSLSEILSFKTM